jgi:nitrogen fixation protein NifU and related proteins
MDGILDLYGDVIQDHRRKPRNYRAMEAPARRVEAFNPLCGDHFTVYLDMDGDTIKDASFQGTGCAISTASASVMTQTIKGKSSAEAEQLFTNFHDLVTGKISASEDLGKIVIFQGVSNHPLRVKCATLAWHALRAALRGEQEAVSTE